MDKQFVFQPIGIVHSCFTEKFGIPRQPGLAGAARASLEILPPYDRDEAFNGLADVSHLWIVFVFHGNPAGRWKPTVRPPRLGGNRRIGVFATRSGFRPNAINLKQLLSCDPFYETMKTAKAHDEICEQLQPFCLLHVKA